jgi:phosphate acetyltransferase
MTKAVMIIPTSVKVDLTRVTLGLVKAFQNIGINAGYFHPVNQKKQPLENNSGSIGIDHTERLLANGESNELLEEIFALFEKEAIGKEIIVVKGLTSKAEQPYLVALNRAIAQALNADVIFLASNTSPSAVSQIDILAHLFERTTHTKIAGYILSHCDTPGDFISSKVFFLGAIPNSCSQSSIKSAINCIAEQFNHGILKEIVHAPCKECVSSIKFRHQLLSRAKAANKTIALPESNDIRILTAANICTRRNIANCLLLGDINEINDIAYRHGMEINPAIKIINPAEIADNYITHLMEIRKNKGLTIEEAKALLQDPMVVATMMLENNEIDGIVSGAAHTTANTIRPALQIIKTQPNMELVSSIFFMCLPEEIIAYSDCAINPNPTPQQLAEIAIQSTDSAKLFGINPKVAMISYSTLGSGGGKDVDDVLEATEIVRKKRPDIIIDGPLQYDAAFVEDVGRQKAPNSPVAGQANVFIFPNLNTGNALYKAVQRSANVIAIGPMLQGLRKPVNDLSRGCLVEDIVFTVALTAIQATQNNY